MGKLGSNKQDAVVGIEFRAGGLAVAMLRGVAASNPALEYSDFHAGDEQEQPALLHDLVQRNGLKGLPCFGVLAQGAYDMFQVEPPEVPRAERNQAVKWRLKDLLDFPLEEAVVEVFDPPTLANRRSTSVNAVVCRRGQVTRAAESTRAAGLDLRALDIVELAQRNLVAALPDNGKGVAMLSLTEEAGLITLVRESELYLARDLDIGLAALREASAKGASPGAEPATWQTVVLELQRSLDYYESNFAMPAITRLLLHPPGEGVAGLLDHLRDNLPGLNCSALEPAMLLDGALALAPDCLNALGAALRGASA